MKALLFTLLASLLQGAECPKGMVGASRDKAVALRLANKDSIGIGIHTKVCVQEGFQDLLPAVAPAEALDPALAPKPARKKSLFFWRPWGRK